MTNPTQSPDDKLLLEFREHVKKLPFNERKQAAAMYTIFEQIINSKKEEEKQNEVAFNDYSDAINAITEKMDEIIEGKRPVSQEELTHWKDTVDQTYVVDPQHNTGTPIKQFWRKFIENSNTYHAEHDLPILDHLVHIETLQETDKVDPSCSSLTVKFGFTPNEYFKNTTLTVKLITKNMDLLQSEGTVIEWTNNPTLKKTTKTQKNKRTGQTRTVTKETQMKTFFEIFNNYTAEDQEDEPAQEDEEEEGPTMNLFTLSETMDEINDLLPYALEYYLGVADDGDEEDDEEVIEEEDEEDEDEDDSEDNRKGKGAGKKASKKVSRKTSEAEKKKDDTKEAGTAKSPECKQQ